MTYTNLSPNKTDKSRSKNKLIIIFSSLAILVFLISTIVYFVHAINSHFQSDPFSSKIFSLKVNDSFIKVQGTRIDFLDQFSELKACTISTTKQMKSELDDITCNGKLILNIANYEKDHTYTITDTLYINEQPITIGSKKNEVLAVLNSSKQLVPDTYPDTYKESVPNAKNKCGYPEFFKLDIRYGLGEQTDPSQELAESITITPSNSKRCTI